LSTLYHLSGHTLASSITLPLIEEPIGSGAAQITFGLHRSDPDVGGCVWLTQSRLPDGSVWLSVGTAGSQSVLHFPHLATFFVNKGASNISCFAPLGTSLDTIRHLLLDQVFPLVSSNRGELVVHASAVVLGTTAVVLMGESGKGKSTLAAGFCAQGHTLITDDSFLLRECLDGLYAVPSYPGLRLWPDTTAVFGEEATSHQRVWQHSSKCLITGALVSFAMEPARVGSFYILGEDAAEIAIEPMESSNAFFVLMNGYFLLDIISPERLARQFMRLAAIANKFRFFRLAYPRRLSALADVVAAIRWHAEDYA
jgi:hypothetical protein